MSKPHLISPAYPVFLSVVLVVHNKAEQLRPLLLEISTILSASVLDYELIIVDNASTDNNLVLLKTLTGELGIPNLQVYALTKRVATEIATWAGMENALGDFVAVMDILRDEPIYLLKMLEAAVAGSDVIFARSNTCAQNRLTYRAGAAFFNSLYKWCNGVDLSKDAPHFRMLSRRVIGFIRQHPQPALAYRHLPATGGFIKTNLTYSTSKTARSENRLFESIDRGIHLLVSTTRMPMRLVTSLSMFGAVSNVLYSIYVMGIWLFKADVAPGWVSLSMQQSGMFFLISLVLMVLGEYLIQMARISNDGPLYHVAQEFTSARILRRDKLNLEVVLPESAFECVAAKG